MRSEAKTDPRRLEKNAALYRSYRDLTAELGMSSASLAERTGYSPNAVSAWNTARSPVPKVVVEYLKLLAAIRRIGK